MRYFAFVIGIGLLILGILGFIPNLMEGLKANTWLNIFYLLSGTLGIVAGFFSRLILRFYFQLFGVIFAILAILGFIFGNREILDFLASNSPNTWFHVIIAIVCLILGYGSRD